MRETGLKAGRVPRGPIMLMYRVYKYVLPAVASQLDALRERANRIPDDELRMQALSSMTEKRFHCQGGAVYAAARPQHRDVLIPLIVALQTISDYLDNLCDRSTSLSEDDFRLLHQSMLDAVNPGAELRNYYALRKENDDSGYLHHLVQICQECTAHLPSYHKVRPYVTELVGLYCDLQVYKHIRKDLREPRLLQWWDLHRGRYSHLKWNEFAAATGSTLGVFMLFLAAADADLTDEQALQIRNCYFPHLCALHILLDYLIDQEEDRLGGDLNFCNYYDNTSHVVQRIGDIVRLARQDVTRLPDGRFHRLIIEGLLALYLSDPKVSRQEDVRRISRSLMRGSPATRLFFLLNSLWIRKKKA